MSDNTKIEWTDATWNPITGCSVVSAGCKHCYAMKLAGSRLRNHPSRHGLTVDTAAGPVWNGKVRFNPQWLDQPLRWKRPRRVFVCAHGDLFHESVPAEWIDQIFAVMAQSPQHTFQVLTKRPERALNWFMRVSLVTASDQLVRSSGGKWPLPNVWLGVSVEDQAAADERIPFLLQCPAAVRWLSCEPLLGPINLLSKLGRSLVDGCSCVVVGPDVKPGTHSSICPSQLPGIHWVVAGGESGRGARAMHPDWARSLRDQCATAGVSFFFKQWGEWAPEDVCERNANNGWYEDFPEDGGLPRHEFNDHSTPCLRTEMWRLGKKYDDHMLDGVKHQTYPAVHLAARG